MLDGRLDYRLTSPARSIGNLRLAYCGSEAVYGGGEAIALRDNSTSPLPCDT